MSVSFSPLRPLSLLLPVSPLSTCWSRTGPQVRDRGRRGVEIGGTVAGHSYRFKEQTSSTERSEWTGGWQDESVGKSCHRVTSFPFRGENPFYLRLSFGPWRNLLSPRFFISGSPCQRLRHLKILETSIRTTRWNEGTEGGPFNRQFVVVWVPTPDLEVLSPFPSPILSWDRVSIRPL